MKVILDENKKVYGLSEEDKKSIMNDLMVENPAYINAVKYSGYNRISLPKYLSYYEDKGDHIEVPIGYELPIKIRTVLDNRKEVTVDYPKIDIKLRDVQEEAMFSYLEDPSKGMMCLATGMGKSILGMYLAQALKQRTLVIVHKNDLVIGWNKDIKKAFNGEVKPGLIKAQDRRVGDQITIATIQTLSRMKEEELEQYLRMFGMVIVDECLVGDTLIAKEDGGLTPIKDIKNKDLLIGGEVSNQFSRQSEIWRVDSQHSTLEGSPTHPTFVVPREVVDIKSKQRGVNNFSKEDLEVRPLKDIREGDYLPILKEVPHTTRKEWSSEQLAFVALIQADGHLDKVGNRIKVNMTPKDQDYIIKVFREGVNSFSITEEVKQSIDCRGNTTVWVTSKSLKNTLENTFDIARGKKSTSIIANEEIQYSSLEAIQTYLETLFNCEGDISGDRDNNCRVNYNTTSKNMALTVSHLLKKFGIVANYQEIVRSEVEHNNTYRLTIGGSDFNIFCDNLNLIDRKTFKYKNKNLIRTGYQFDEYVLMRVKKSYNTGRQEEVYDYTTSTHRFIANGTLTHNCHHTPANTYSVISKFSCPYKIGLSATPERSDGLDKVMHFYLGDFCYVSTESDEEGVILPVEVRVRNSNAFYIPQVKKKGVGYVLATEEDKNEVKKDIDSVPYKLRPRISHFAIDDEVQRDEKYRETYLADILREYSEGNSIIVFLSQKEHCRLVQSLLEDKGIPKDRIQLYYGDSTEPKEELMKRAEEERNLITIATYSIATEGTNVKQWEVAFLLSSVNNGKNVEQAIGRIRRVDDNKLDVVRVYDYRHPNVYTFNRHGMTRDKRYLKLNFKIDRVRRTL